MTNTPSISRSDRTTLMRDIDKTEFGSIEDAIEEAIGTAYTWGYEAGDEAGYARGKEEES